MPTPMPWVEVQLQGAGRPTRQETGRPPEHSPLTHTLHLRNVGAALLQFQRVGQVGAGAGSWGCTDQQLLRLHWGNARTAHPRAQQHRAPVSCFRIFSQAYTCGFLFLLRASVSLPGQELDERVESVQDGVPRGPQRSPDASLFLKRYFFGASRIA